MFLRLPEQRQTTLRAACSVSGRGYWTGKSNTLHFRPAAENTGIQFELFGQRVAANADNACGLPLRTRLGQSPAAFDMIEHVMAALAGLRVDNCVVQCDESEMPGFDGSSLALALAINSVGTIEQPAPRQSFVIDRPITVRAGDSCVEAVPSASGALELEYQLEYPEDSPIPGGSFSAVITPETFLNQIAPARTFVTEQEANALQSQGLAGHVTDQDLLVFTPVGPRNNTLRFDNECARHKLLDLLGDLALAGVNLVGRITARKSGHQLNAEMTRALRQRWSATEQNLRPPLAA